MIEGKVPDGSGRIIKAERHVWQINIHQKYFTRVVLQIVDYFDDFLCRVCLENHVSESALIRCLKMHRNDTVNFYLDNLLIEESEK